MILTILICGQKYFVYYFVSTLVLPSFADYS